MGVVRERKGDVPVLFSELIDNWSIPIDRCILFLLGIWNTSTYVVLLFYHQALFSTGSR